MSCPKRVPEYPQFIHSLLHAASEDSLGPEQKQPSLSATRAEGRCQPLLSLPPSHCMKESQGNGLPCESTGAACSKSNDRLNAPSFSFP